MAKLGYNATAAKRMVAEAALRDALKLIEEVRPTGGPRAYSTSSYSIAMHLSRHAADQLRLSEGP